MFKSGRMDVFIINTAIIIIALFYLPLKSVAASAERNIAEYYFTDNSALQKEQLEFFPGQEEKVLMDADGLPYLEISLQKPSGKCGITLKTQVNVQPSIILSFDYRTNSADKITVLASDKNGNSFKTEISACANWTMAVLPLSDLKSIDGKRIEINTGLKDISISAEATSAALKLDVRDILVSRTPDSLGGERISYSAYPMFNWPRAESSGYCLKYSQCPEFPASETSRIDTVYNFNTPEHPLAPGTWYWKVKLKNHKEVFSRGKLTIPPQAHNFKIPEFSFEELAKTPHPRLRNLAGLIAKADSSLFSKAQNALPSGIPPDPPAFKGIPYKSQEWVDWFKMIYELMAVNVGPGLSSIGQAAEATGDYALKQKAKKMLLDISKNWDPEKGASNMKNGGDLETGSVLQGMCWCFDAAYEIMSEEEKRIALEAISRRGRQFSDGINPFRLSEAQNHSWNMATTLSFAAIVCAGHQKEAEAWFKFSLELYAYRFLPSMGFDGDNNEGLHYWAFGGGFIMQYADLMRQVCGIDLYKHPWLMKTAQFSVYCAPPGGFIVSFADYAQNGLPNHSNKGPVFKTFTGQLGERTEDPYALWYSGIPYSGTVKAKAPADIPQSKYYRHTGWTVFNTCLADGRRNTAVGFHCGKYYAAHQHGDQNSFVINAYGEKLAVDGGYYDWYGSPHFNEYSTQTKAHNTLLVDGKGQAVRRVGADGCMSGFHDSLSWGYVEGDASNPGIYNGALSRFKRKLVFIKPSFVIIYDSISSENASVYSCLLHSQGDSPIKTEPGTGSFMINRPRAWLYGKVIAPALAVMNISEGYEVLPSAPLSSTPMKKEDIEREWTFSISNPQKEKNIEFLIGLQIGNNNNTEKGYADFSRLENNSCIGLIANAFRQNIILIFNRKPGRRIQPLYGLETDGSIAAVKLGTNGEIIDALVIDGAFLSYKGCNIYRSELSGNWSMKKAQQPSMQLGNSTIFKVSGKNIPCDVFRSQDADGKFVTVVTALVSVEKQTLYKISSDSNVLNYRVSCQKTELTGSVNGSRLSGFILLQSGEYIFTFTSTEIVSDISLSPSSSDSYKAEAFPESYVLPDDAVCIEAEFPSAMSSSVKMSVKEKDGASNGKASCGKGEMAGEWIEWKYYIPSTQDYFLLIRANGTENNILKAVSIDGSSPFFIEWNATVPWWDNNKKTVWRFFHVPSKMHLEKGEHTIRFFSVSSGSDIDMLAFVPAG